MTDTGSSLTMTATTSSSSSPAAGKVLRRTDSSTAQQQQHQQQPQQQEDSCGVGCFSVPGRHSSQVQVGGFDLQQSEMLPCNENVKFCV